MAASASKQITYVWEGKDKKGKAVKGEMRATGDSFVSATLRRQGITVTKVKKQSSIEITPTCTTCLKSNFSTRLRIKTIRK